MATNLQNTLKFYEDKVVNADLREQAILTLLEAGDAVGPTYRRSLEAELKQAEAEYHRVMVKRNIARRMVEMTEG